MRTLWSAEGQNEPFPTLEESAGGDDKRELSWGSTGMRGSERTEKGPVFGAAVKNGKERSMVGSTGPQLPF